MVNTEKPTGKNEAKKLAVAPSGVPLRGSAPKPEKMKAENKAPVQKKSSKDDSDEPKKETPNQKSEISSSTKQSKYSSSKEAPKPIQKKPKVKKTEAVVNATSLPVSTKYSMAICRFIKNKKIVTAIKDLEQVVLKKKAVPMKGEIPHRKGPMMSGRFPKKASEHFIILLKSLIANSVMHDIDDPVVVEAVANMASRPYGKFGRVKKKRTHVRLVAKTAAPKKSKNKMKKENAPKGVPSKEGKK